jgi:nucleoside-diphosphate-sugar epimerase
VKISGSRFLVTGGTGFIGSALVRGLLANGAWVRSLDDDSRGASHRLDDLDAGAKARLELVRGDIRDPVAVAAAVAGVDSVLHLAYVNGTEYFYSKPELVLEVAVKGMMNVLDGCIAHGVRDLVLASSSEVYQTPPTVPTDERAPLIVPDVLNPRYSYGGGKIISELLAVNYGRKHFTRVAIFRPHNCYGPDMGNEHVIPQLTRRLHELAVATPGPLTLPIQGDGSEIRAFVYIDDLVDGVLRVITDGDHLGIFHIGTDVEVAIGELARSIGRVLGREVTLQPGPLQAGGTLRRCPDIGKLRALGYTPKTSIEVGLGRTVSWYIDQIEKTEKLGKRKGDPQ